MVMRYFGSKELLFAAATTLKIDRGYLARVPKSKIGEAIIRDGLDRWDDPQWGNNVIAMVRTSMSNLAAREKFNNGTWRVSPPCRVLYSNTTGSSCRRKPWR
jgi:hypothetical protein